MTPSSKPKKVLLLYRAMIPSLRLCAHCQMEYLHARGKLLYRACKVSAVTGEDLSWADVVLLGRLDNWFEYHLAKQLHEAQKPLIYIIDDDLLNVPSDISLSSYYSLPRIQTYIRSMIAFSDAIISPSPLLLQRYATNGKVAIQIEEPAINPIPFTPHDSNRPVTIGFAASVTRTGDMESILQESLEAIKTKYRSRVQFVFFGAIPSFAQSLEASAIPYCNSYDDYRQMLNTAKWDIGLAPLPDTAFHACKHYNKFVEYSAAAILGVYSAVMPYTRLKDIGEYCILCDNTTDAWTQALSELIDDAPKRERLRAQANAYVNEKMNVPVCADNLFTQLEDLLFKSSPPVRQKHWKLRRLKIGMLLSRCFYFVRRHGLKAPYVLINKFFGLIKKR